MKSNLFWSGALAMACFQSLVQDFFGQQGYIDHINNNWISGRITIPLAVTGLILVTASLIGNKHINNKQNNDA